jgi:hypothetical protein
MFKPDINTLCQKWAHTMAKSKQGIHFFRIIKGGEEKGIWIKNISETKLQIKFC